MNIDTIAVLPALVGRIASTSVPSSSFASHLLRFDDLAACGARGPGEPRV